MNKENTKGFNEINMAELQDIEGGVVIGIIGLVFGGIGTAIAVGTAIYGLGYAQGQRAGYREKYGY